MFLDLNAEFFSWVRGALIVLFVLHGLLYINNRQKLFLFYSIYTFLFTLNFIFLNSQFANEKTILLVSLPLFYFIIYIYFYFAREVLMFKKVIPNNDNKLKKWAGYLFLSSLIIYLSQFFVPKNIFYILNLILIIAVVYFILTTHQKVKKSKVVLSTLFSSGIIIILFTAAFYFFSVTTSLKNDIQLYGFHPISLIYFGVLVEMFVFAIIFGFRITTLENEEVAINLKLVKQMADTEELRMEMLKSQMNPHFIFNMLNSINSLIIKNEIESASDYITKFSRFIREILNSSRKTHMSLADEFNIIKLYVILEQTRVEGGFSYEVIIEDNISAYFIQIPPMFLQPFIENAIWHGLVPHQGEKKLTLRLRKVDKSYYLDVIDSGIGYKKGIEIAKTKMVKSSGIAVEIVKNRLQSLYRNQSTDVIIEDLTSEKTSGTKVTFKFPIEEF